MTQEIAKTETPSLLSGFDDLQTQINLFLKPLKDLKVTDQLSMESGLANLAGLKKWEKQVNDKRTSLTKPLDEQKKILMDHEKKIMKPIEEVQNHIKKQLCAYEVILEAKRKEDFEKAEIERKRLEKEAAEKLAAEKEELEAETMFGTEEQKAEAQAKLEVITERVNTEVQTTHAAVVTSIAATKVSGVSRPWVFEITDETKVPVMFKTVDDKKIRQAVSSGVREIEGVRIFQEIRVNARG